VDEWCLYTRPDFLSAPPAPPATRAHRHPLLKCCFRLRTFLSARGLRARALPGYALKKSQARCHRSGFVGSGTRKWSRGTVGAAVVLNRGCGPVSRVENRSRDGSGHGSAVDGVIVDEFRGCSRLLVHLDCRRRGLGLRIAQRLGGQAEMLEDALDDGGLFEERDDFHGPSQHEHTITSTAKTRVNSAAQSSRCLDRAGETHSGAVGEGGVDRSARRTTFARRRLVGAKTPWRRVRLADTRGIKGAMSSTPVETSLDRPSDRGCFMLHAKRPSTSSLSLESAAPPRAPDAATAPAWPTSRRAPAAGDRTRDGGRHSR
jgi:hypothetical protein